MHRWSDEESHGEGEGPHVAHALLLSHVVIADLVAQVTDAHHHQDRHEEAVEDGVSIDPHTAGANDGTGHDVAVDLGEVSLRFVRDVGDLEGCGESIKFDVVLKEAGH